MKNRLLFGILLVAALAPSCGGGGGGGRGRPAPVGPRWQEVYRTPTSVDLRAVRFGNSMSGIAAGKFGTFVRTDDGGAHWRQLEFTPDSTTGDILAMAVGSTTAFAVGQNPSGGAIAWISTDANQFVQPDSLPTTFTDPWVDVALIFPAGNAATAATIRLRPSGFIDAYQGTLLNSYDSRHNDQTGAPPPVPDTPWTSANGIVAFGSSGTWLVCGDNGGVGQIRKTTNDGQFFTTCSVPASCPILRRMSFVNATTGFVCGESNTILKTTDGQTFTDILTPKPAGLPAGNLLGISFWDSTLGFAVGQGGRIYRLRFASSVWNWEVMTSPTGEDLYDVAFGDAGTVYAVGNNGVVLKCTNPTALPFGNVTWTKVSGPAANPTAVFNAVDFRPDGVIGLAVGNAGALFRTLDAGATWTAFNTGIGAVNLTSVSIPKTGSGTVAFVGASTGAIFVNTDLQNAGTWTSAAGFPAQPVRALLFPKDDSAGIAAGDAGSFATLSFSSPTLTVSSQTLNPLPSANVNAAAADPTGDKLYLAGDGGYLVESLNAGATWAAVSPAPPNVSIRALAAPSGSVFQFFAAASTGDIHRLSVGAAPAWTTTAGAPIGTPVAMSFSSQTTGIVVTQDATKGGVYWTTTSGGLWTKSVLHVPVDAGPHVLNGCWLHPSNLAYVVGGNGLIMRTQTLGQ